MTTSFAYQLPAESLENIITQVYGYENLLDIRYEFGSWIDHVIHTNNLHINNERHNLNEFKNYLEHLRINNQLPIVLFEKITQNPSQSYSSFIQCICNELIAINIEKKLQALEALKNQCQIKSAQNTNKDLEINFQAIILKVEEVLNIIYIQYLLPLKFEHKPTSKRINLNLVEHWCTIIAETLLKTKEEVSTFSKGIELCGFVGIEKPDLTPLLVKIQEILRNLINNSFVIENEPNQVMKTKTKFNTSVRLLLGNYLTLAKDPVVKVSIVSKTQIQYIKDYNRVNRSSSGELVNNTDKLTYDEGTKKTLANFKNLQLTSIKRGDKKGNECVTDEKFALLFETNIAVQHGDLVVSIWTISNPIVVIVHGNQEPQAKATLLWANISDNPFNEDVNVPWNKLASELNCKCKSMTGKELTNENMHFLAEKAFNVILSKPIPTDLMISWERFCKTLIPDRQFSFWEWFYATLKLTREHLRNHWQNGNILGYIHKNYVFHCLYGRLVGTFLLRFSDSELGGISIAKSNSNENGIFIDHLAPFKASDLSIRSLSDRISDLRSLTILFPNKPKAEAFGTPKIALGTTGLKAGYIPTGIVTVIDPNSTKFQGDISPQSFTASSPSSSSSIGSPTEFQYFTNEGAQSHFRQDQTMPSPPVDIFPTTLMDILENYGANNSL